jgi:DNA-binding response OmpR family regulator
MKNKVMVIDDEPLICQLLMYQLGGAGYEVVAFQNGQEALKQLPLLRPDVILLDVMMPGLSGWDVCREIRLALSIPVIMLTAKCAEHDVITGLNSGADDYIAKPFSLSHLLARVEAVLRRTQVPQVTTSRLSNRPDRSSLQLQYATATLAPQGEAIHPAFGARVDTATPSTDQWQAPRLGDQLAAARRQRGLSLHQAERACGVRWEFLQALEYEHYHFVPRLQLRRALYAYGMLLGIDLNQILGVSPKRESSLALPAAAAVVLFVFLLLLLVFYIL